MHLNFYIRLIMYYVYYRYRLRRVKSKLFFKIGTITFVIKFTRYPFYIILHVLVHFDIFKFQ